MDILYRCIEYPKYVPPGIFRSEWVNDLKDLEREPLSHCECVGKVTFTRPFLILGKVTFEEQVNVLERYCKGDVS